ncbi:MAG: LacI family DNA-binding transcriptional regulator [Hyphomicrobiales bacterium]
MSTSGSAKVTIREVAAAAGVSVGTVSRVLNNHSSVRPPMRKAVMDAVRALGYEPNEAARQLRATRTKALAILIDDVNHAMNGVAVHGADDVAQGRGYSLLVAETRGDPDRELELVQSMLGRRVEGLLCMPRQSRTAILAAASRSRVPVVFFGQVSQLDGAVSALIDEDAATRESVDDFLRHGHRHLAIVGDERPLSHRRINAIRQCLADRSDKTRVSVVVEPLEQLAEATGTLLSRAGRPSGVIVLTHRCLPPVLLGVRKAGLALPQDVSLVAFGDSEWAAAYRPAISVISGPYREHVAAATNLLIDLIQGAANEDATLVHTSEYTRRESLAAAPHLPASPRRAPRR